MICSVGYSGSKIARVPFTESMKKVRYVKNFNNYARQVLVKNNTNDY